MRNLWAFSWKCHHCGFKKYQGPTPEKCDQCGKGDKLKPGMIFTVEPTINAGKRDVRLLPDGWTVVTKDHSLSAQWEHTVLVTDTGYEILTKREEENLAC